MLFLAFALSATQAARAAELAAPAEMAARCAAPVRRHGLLGGLAKGLANAAPLIGGHGSGLQIVTGLAGQTLAAGAEAQAASAACSTPND